MTTTPTPSPDAVEALALALDDVANAPFDKQFAASLIDELKERGFTITRAAPMSEAELEREAESIANYYIEDIEHPLTSVSNRVNAGLEIINLAKKYRGQ